MVHVVGHGVGVSLEVVDWYFFAIDFLPALDIDDEVAVEEDSVRNIEELGVDFDVPLDSLFMGDFCVIVLVCSVSDHVEELL